MVNRENISGNLVLAIWFLQIGLRLHQKLSHGDWKLSDGAWNWPIGVSKLSNRDSKKVSNHDSNVSHGDWKRLNGHYQLFNPNSMLSKDEPRLCYHDSKLDNEHGNISNGDWKLSYGDCTPSNGDWRLCFQSPLDSFQSPLDSFQSPLDGFVKTIFGLNQSFLRGRLVKTIFGLNVPLDSFQVVPPWAPRQKNLWFESPLDSIQSPLDGFHREIALNRS